MGTAWRTPAADPSEATTPVRIIALEGKVEVLRAGSIDWDPAYTNQVLRPGDRGRTGPHSRVVLQLRDLSVVPIGERSEFLIHPPPPKARKSVFFRLLQGMAYFFHRGEPADVEFSSPTAIAAIRGTEFNFAVAPDGQTTVTMIDGEVNLSNDAGSVRLSSGEQGVAKPGQPPTKTAVINALRVVQWALYYPGVLDPAELPLPPSAIRALADSLEAYRQGDLPQALVRYPAGREPQSDAETVYLAALLLAVGQVEQTQALLDKLPSPSPGTSPTREQRLAGALRLVIDTVTMQESPETGARSSPALAGAPRITPSDQSPLASEWLAESYARQVQWDLKGALNAARHAATQSPQFGFAWARVAELEFGFGRTRQAAKALDRALELTPRNAQALALKGFVLAAENRVREALNFFERAIAADPALGNAWLGRGLCRIRLGQTRAGRDDLLVAAAREPQRALLRSYLGKAFSQTGDNERAMHELDLAKRFDPNDPTAWLYAALINQQRNRINEAIADLEQSLALNRNRRVYRSRLLLDQDQAIRGANLARLYQDAGMDEVSLREAVRAVHADYANYSAHLFLANSYNALRDPRQINLRYETPWLSEYLLANLLSPVGAGILSPQVTQQDYTRLFEQNRLGLASSTEYFSNGDWIQNAAQWGRWDRTAYSLDFSYRSENGFWPNQTLEQRTLSARVKHQLGLRDVLYLQLVHYDARAGDLTPHYSVDMVNPGLRIRERQEPLLLAGWHHQWNPNHHTLFLFGRLADDLEVLNPQQGTLFLSRDIAGLVAKVRPMTVEQDYASDATIYTTELQHMFQTEPQTLVVGVRYQNGGFDSRNDHGQATIPTLDPILAGVVQSQLDAFGPQAVEADFNRVSAYAYEHVHLAEPLTLVAGISYDRVHYPRNFRFAPLARGEDTTDRVSPKVGLIWTPAAATTLRAAYSRALGGVSFDQSFQLEPTQLAGFNQTWRSLLPEAVAGANAVPRFESWGISLEQKLPTRTYLGAAFEWLQSDLSRQVGVFEFDAPLLSQSLTRERLDFRERTLVLTADQLLGREWAVGVRYRLSQADLDSTLAELPPGAQYLAGTARSQDLTSILHQVRLLARYHHPCGVFAQAEADWYQQSNQGYSPNRPGDDFWQVHLFVGYRLPRRQAEVRLGLLNVADQDYRLNPLNLTAAIPRERTLTVSFQFNF